MAIASEHICFPPPTRWQFALIHELIAGGAAASAWMTIDRCGTAALARPRTSYACVWCSDDDVCATTFHSAARVTA